ncbi:hypothetical protein [Tessaracoccus coleopterorum]|uniref:hypothetical protein n=1 Tax=Tessaracoccus coleopterorum TaxID=2714950 RepID=UPI0038CDC1BD
MHIPSRAFDPRGCGRLPRTGPHRRGARLRGVHRRPLHLRLVAARPWAAALLDPASNMARFAARFAPYGEPADGTRDALYFGFHRETGDGTTLDLDTLPQWSSLQRAVVSRLRAGQMTVQAGSMPLR